MGQRDVLDADLEADPVMLTVRDRDILCAQPVEAWLRLEDGAPAELLLKPAVYRPNPQPTCSCPVDAVVQIDRLVDWDEGLRVFWGVTPGEIVELGLVGGVTGAD